jgi:hypothetical protein
MKKYFLFFILFTFIVLTGFLSSCHNKKILCQKCLHKESKTCHTGLCRYILPKETIEKTDKEYFDDTQDNQS